MKQLEIVFAILATGSLLFSGCSKKNIPSGALVLTPWHGELSLDGNLDEPAWKSAAQATLRRSDGRSDARQMTVVMLAYDKTRLIIGCQCEDEDIFSPYKKRDDPLYLQEAVEMFFDPDGDEGDYMEFEVSPAGVLFDASFTARRQGMDLGFNPASEVGVKVTGTLNNRKDKDKSWDVELAIPFSQMVGRGRRPPKPGDCWRANFFRLDKTRTWSEASSWRRTSGDFHDLAAFGQICFGYP